MVAANLVSTLIGIPITMVVWFIVELSIGFAVGSAVKSLNHPLPTVADYLFSVTIGAAWLGPDESQLYWMVPTAMLVLLIPFFYVSWIIERSVARHYLAEIRKEQISWVTFYANLYSYGLLALIVVGWLIGSLLQAYAPRQ